jgi:putative transposase
MSDSQQQPDRSENKWLPRLEKAHYQGHAVVFWTFVVNQRRTGWLDSSFHARFREMMLHAMAREMLLCPVYVLMPDHLHFILAGTAPTSDQRKAISFLRTHLKPHPAEWQNQAHDHVLREHEFERNAFQKTVHYILQNPVRANLENDSTAWPWLGCCIPGYPTLHPTMDSYWDKFWKIYWMKRNENS